MRIALLSHDFPPVTRIAAMRAYSFARHWAADGHEVDVFTVDPFSDLTLIGDRSDFPGLNRVKVIAVPFLGIFSKGSDLKSQERDSEIKPKSHQGVLQRLRSLWRAKLRFLPIGIFMDVGLLSLPLMARALKRSHQERPYDIILATYPTPAVLICAWWAARGAKTRWVADMRDLWVGGHLYRAWGPFHWFDRLIQKILLGDADKVVVINKQHRALYRAYCRVEPVIATNGFEEEDYAPVRVSALTNRSPDAPFRIVYTGTIFGRHRFPVALLDALEMELAIDPELPVKLEVAFYSSDPEELMAEVIRKGLSSVVKFYAPVTRRDVIRIQCDADLLLFLDWNSPEDPGSISGKIFEYFASGRPVICVGGFGGSPASALIESVQGGYCWNSDINTIRIGLRQILAGNLKSGADKISISQYSRKVIARNLLMAISSDD